MNKTLDIDRICLLLEEVSEFLNERIKKLKKTNIEDECFFVISLCKDKNI